MARDFVILGQDSEPHPDVNSGSSSGLNRGSRRGSSRGSNPTLCGARVDERLVAEGWVPRHVADAVRATESIELYESLGFEVLTRKLTSADYDPQCRDCIASACASLVLIYTRKKDSGEFA